MFGNKQTPASTIEVADLNAIPDTNAKKPAMIGLLALIFGFGGFMLWAFFAPLDQGVPGSGTVRVAGERKVVQALTGGVIEHIKIREGDQVREGQILIQLNKVQAESQLRIIMGQWSSARAIQVRLRAEQAGLHQITWPNDLLNFKADERVSAAIELQNQQFATRKAELNNTEEIFKRNLDGLEEQLAGYKAIKQSHLDQLKFQQQELTGLRDLAKDGYVARNRLLEAERGAAQLTAQLAEDVSNIGRTQQAIAETRLKSLKEQQNFRQDVEAKLADYNREVNNLADRLTAAQFDVDHTEIKASSAGQVVGLTIHTEGGVLQAGQKLMDIVPNQTALIIETKFSPLVIDKLKPGLKVDLHFSTLNRVDTPTLQGIIRTVSADQLIDEATRQPYFSAEIVVTPESMKALGALNLEIRPGLPADVLVKTGERSMMNYLMKPFTRRVLSAFKEE